MTDLDKTFFKRRYGNAKKQLDAISEVLGASRHSDLASLAQYYVTRCTTLEEALRAALQENPGWYSQAAKKAVRLMDEPDDPAVIDIPGKGRVRIQTDDTEAERVRRELDRRVEQAEGDDE